MSVQQAGRKQDIEGIALADQIDQSPHLAVADADAQLAHRNTHPAVVAGDAQVRCHRQFAAAAHGEPSNHRDGGRGHVGKGLERPVHDVVVDPALGGVGAVFFEILNVRPRRKGLFPRAGDDDGPNIAVGVQLPHDVGKITPHGEADGVPLLGPVEGDRRHGGRGVEKDVVVQSLSVLFRLFSLSCFDGSGQACLAS